MKDWERRMEWPLATAATAFLIAYAWPIIDPTDPADVLRTCRIITWVVWGLFALDYLIRLTAAPHRPTFVRHNLFDLAVIALPVLRPLRLLRLVVLLRIVNRKATNDLRGRVAAYVIGGSALVAFVGSLAVLDAERQAKGANITTFGDAMWWAFTTMTTVGYGDRYPVTTTGRVAAVGLMLGGIAVLGVVTATFASWLVERVSAETEATTDLHDEVIALRAQTEELTALVRELLATGTHPAAPSRASRRDPELEAPSRTVHGESLVSAPPGDNPLPRSDR